jgi:hypothetical protein
VHECHGQGSWGTSTRRFDDALEGKLKNSIVRGPAGEVNVARFLDDFQENIDRLEERLKPEYAASAEVATLLRQGSAIDRFLRQQPAGTRGESEWNRLATDLKTLAAAYGAEFPLAEGASVRRIGDRELAASVEQIEESAERLKRALDNELKKDPSVQSSARQAIVGEADQLSKDAKTLRSRIKDSKPSSAEAEHVMERAAKLRAFIDTHKLSASSGTLATMSPAMQTVAAAYGKSPATATR